MPLYRTGRSSIFLSTPSARRATGGRSLVDLRLFDFYPRPPRGGRPCFPPRPRRWGEFLSTPSARRATPILRHGMKSSKNFYPRPPRGGRPRTSLHRRACPRYFYPRPPRGGRPPGRTPTSGFKRDFYPRPPRGGRPATMDCFSTARIISIHALREEGDACFGSNHPNLLLISIHALREEGDLCDFGLVPVVFHFYPRPPRGGRPGGILVH